MYTTPQDVRDLLGVSIEDASDEILKEFIEKAQRVVLKHITVKVKDEVMSGSINGQNNTFSVSNKYLADVDFDEQVTTSDFKIYGWKDADDPGTKVELTCSTFYPEYGIFVLSEAPDPNTYEILTCDYSYYTCQIDWTLVELATAYYAAFLWVARELFLVPEEWALGNLRIRQREPRRHYRTEFYNIIKYLRRLPMDMTSYRKMVTTPRVRGEFTGPRTLQEYLDRLSRMKVKT
ncbi:MAG: hypothetical protein DRP15_00925 [Candidatus Aenigmatarchaeota archaeon]|nr:MAG: hypothetical protein DRP15_00925 [Candidatus Aenigmarchaeota archaeon]